MEVLKTLIDLFENANTSSENSKSYHRTSEGSKLSFENFCKCTKISDKSHEIKTKVELLRVELLNIVEIVNL